MLVFKRAKGDWKFGILVTPAVHYTPASFASFSGIPTAFISISWLVYSVRIYWKR